MIREEISWDLVGSVLQPMLTCGFVGPTIDERSTTFNQTWSRWDCLLVSLTADDTLQWLTVSATRGGQIIRPPMRLEMMSGMDTFLRSIQDSLGVVCLDITSLQPAVMMYLTKLLLVQARASRLFACYVQPREYAHDDYEFMLSRRFLGLRSVPGFAHRRTDKPHLVAFLGFEGDRLSKVVEEAEFTDIAPIVGFPAYQPGWQNRVLVNCMMSIESTKSMSRLEKCNASSVFEALALIARLGRVHKMLALAPLGTRPHTMACAIYATIAPKTLLIYDHPVEESHRSLGVGPSICYHLSAFIGGRADAFE